MKIVRWGIVLFALIGLFVWFENRPDPAATERQQNCQFWGIKNPDTLTKCRRSAEEEEAATEPFKRAAAELDIARFNRDLAALLEGKTHAKVADYPNRTIEEVEDEAGGMLGFFINGEEAPAFPAKGKAVILIGVIVGSEQNSGDNGPEEGVPETRYFTLETEMHPQGKTEDLSMPTTVNLDIESLNRHERQFIIDHCYPLAITPCRAKVFGHIDEIVGRRDAWRTYIGIVADQADIEPLTWATAFPNGFLSMRTMMEIAKKRQSP